MNKFWTLAVVMLGLSVGSVGCKTLDEYNQLDRANRVLQEDQARLQADLQDCQAMGAQKDTMVDSLNKQLSAKDETIGSLTSEAHNLRDALARAQAILEKQAGRGLESVTIVKQALPDPLHKELKALAEAYADQIEYIAEKGAVRWKADLLFPLGSDQLSGSTDTLRKFAQIVASDAAAGFDVIVVGHTCTTPIRKAATLAEHKSNWHLSAHRAIAVMNLLAGENVAMTRIGVMGYGEHRSIADNATAEGKARNRRVEIYLVPQASVQAVGG